MTETARFIYAPRGPFSLEATAERFTRWPEAVDRFDGETYRRLLPVGRSGVLLEVRQGGTPSRARLHVRLEGTGAGGVAAREAARRVVRVGLGAGFDARPFYRAFRGDPLLADPLRHSRGLRIAGTASLWEAAVTAVLSQQVNLVFAYDLRRKLALAFGRRARFGGIVYVAFPSPERLARESERSLRKFRLSGAKAGTLARLARAFAAGELSERELARLPDEEAIERLMAIKGVGRWTAEIALLRGLGRADVFPGGDLGVVKYLAMELLGQRARVTEARMRRFADRWRPYRGLALVYAYAEMARRRGRVSRVASSPKITS
ncbi:MAG: DNA-3-methyladenine glycosylase family protein [Thermoanaerobaculia bacterium]